MLFWAHVIQSPAFSDIQIAAVEWDGLHIRRACFSLTDVAVQACTFLLYTYQHHLGYVTSFISCSSVVVSSMCSLDVDLLLWAMYYRPIKRCCVGGHLDAVLPLPSIAASTSWTTLEVRECRWDLCVLSRLGIQVFYGLKYFGSQGRHFGCIWSLHPWRTNVPLWQLWGLRGLGIFLV